MRKCFIIVCMCAVAASGVWAEGGVVSVVRSDPRTGRLTRRMVSAETQTPQRTAPASIAKTVDRVARQYELSPQLVHSVIQAESNYDPNAVSPKGAQGLMQLIPSTARRFGVTDAFDPDDNIQGGAKYLKYLLDLYKGDETLALAAYNAGEGAVARYGGVPPYAETQGYVTKIRQRTAAHAVNPAAQPPEEKPAEPPAPVYNPIREVVDSRGRIYYVSH